MIKIARKKRTYADPLTGEVVTETRRKKRKDEYVDWSGKVKRGKKKNSLSP